MPGQRVVRSMIGELAVALASADEAALALAADAPLFLLADLAASLRQSTATSRSTRTLGRISEH